MSIVDDLFSGIELSGYKAGGHGGRVGFGKKPAVIVVDMTNQFTNPRYALGHGENTVAVVAANARLLDAGRRKRVPVFFSNLGLRTSAAEKGVWGEKVGGSKEITSEADAITDELQPREDETIITKPKASVFFGTQLASMLYYLGVDTIIVTGLTTSGCVRATVVDGFSYNFRVIVPVECCGDRATLPHKASLFDMNMKYADVVGLDAVMDYLHTVTVA